MNGMNMVKIADLYKKASEYDLQEVTVAGWIDGIRLMKDICFVSINDGSCFKSLQVTCTDSCSNYGEVKRLKEDSSVVITGTIRLDSSKSNAVEMEMGDFFIEGIARNEHPFKKKGQTLETLRTAQHLRVRTRVFNAIFRIRSILTVAVYDFFCEKGFVNISTPIITPSSFEGAGDMFQLVTQDSKGAIRKDFFGKEAFLAISGQLYNEVFVYTYGNVYSFGPTFRAENSNTTQHLSEFWMIEPEMAFAELEEGIDLAEDFIKFIVKRVLDNAMDELIFLNKRVDDGLVERLKKTYDTKFIRITHDEALSILRDSQKTFEHDIHSCEELFKEHYEYLLDEYFQAPFFITNYPKKDAPFYMKVDADTNTVRNLFCFLPKVGEILGGSEKEDDYDVLKNRIQSLNMNLEEYTYYLDIRKNGSVRHTGLGIGFERCVMFLTGVSNIRDTIPFPRAANKCDF